MSREEKNLADMNNIFDNPQKYPLKLTHESCWVVDVSADLSVDFDESLHDNLGDFSVCQSVLQTVTEKDHQRQ